MILTEAVKSFYSRQFYYTLARNVSGIGMRFICLMIAANVIWITIAMARTYPVVSHLIAMVPEFSAKLPAVTYKDNRISIDKPVPYYLKIGQMPQDYGLVIDTSYKISDVDALTKYMRQNHILLLVTDNKVAMLKEKQGDNVDIRDLSTIGKPFSITHEDWSNYAHMVIKWGALAFYGYMLLIMLVVFIFYHFIATFIDSIVVQIMSAIAQAGLEFEACMRLAAAGRIPVVLIGMIPMLSKPLGSLTWIIWLSYLGFAVIAAKGNKAVSST